MNRQINFTKPDKTPTPAFTLSSASGGLGVFEDLVYVQYRDHVVFSRAVVEEMVPQVREAVGWLKYECDWYVTICYDQDAGAPTLKGGDSKASGLVLVKADILKIQKLSPQNSEYNLNAPKPVDAMSMRSKQKAKNSVQGAKKCVAIQ